MPIRAVSPYLTFNGNAVQAIALYERTLGATTEALVRFADVPEAGMPKEHGERVMHAYIRVGEGSLMASDCLPGSSVVTGNVQVALDFQDPADLAQKFEALAASGKVDFPLHDTFYGGKLGGLTDAFGIQWMFNYMASKS